MSNASGDGGAYQKLPPGWDCKYDQSTGNCYYINYFTKAVQLEDPRTRYKQLQNERCSTESIPLQHMVTQPSGSSASPYHVYPSNSLTAVRAFQERHCQPPPSLHNMSASPLLSSRGQFDMSSPVPLPRSQLTQTPRLGQQHLSRRSTIQETSFTNQIDTDAVVARIQNMFPTAGENHIRLLLKRYMKNIFPKADETLLLDILANADNNVQTASEKLISLGYVKRDFVPAKPNNRPPTTDPALVKQGDDERHIPLRPKAYTEAEKSAMQALLKQKYPQIAERIILMALESVNYAEDRATQILQIVQEEDLQRDQKQHKSMNLQHAQTSLQHATIGEETDVDGAIAHTDSILTVVLETTTTTASTPQPPPPETASTSHNKHMPFTKKHKLPAINVTTPTTATTQIILSNSPIEDDNDGAPINYNATVTNSTVNSNAINNEQHDSSISLTSPSTHSYASPTHSPTRYEPLTTKGILARSSGYAIASCGSGGGGIISGYLHGSSLCSSSYSSYTTSMKLLSSSSSSSSTSSSAASLAGKLTTAVSRRARTKSDSLKHSQRSFTEGSDSQNEHAEFQSIVDRMSTLGHNSELAKGADEKLLLADYVTWNGANPMNMSGQRQLANGPDTGMLSERGYKAAGRNPELCKGAKAGLAKGSIYAQNKSANIKCN